MKIEWAKTIAEAESQQFTAPSAYFEWYEFAHLLNGYAICKEMGVQLGTYVNNLRHVFETHERALTLLEARLLLFFDAREMRFVSGHQPHRRINSLLQFIAEKMKQPYTPLTETEFHELWKRDEAEVRSAFQSKPKDDSKPDGEKKTN